MYFSVDIFNLCVCFGLYIEFRKEEIDYYGKRGRRIVKEDNKL